MKSRKTAQGRRKWFSAQALTNPESNEQLKRAGGDTTRIILGDELQRGQLVGGRYEVISRLGTHKAK